MAKRLRVRDFGTALTFDGSASKVAMSGTLLGPFSQQTISAWVKVVYTGTNDHFFVSRPAATSDQFGMDNTSKNKLDYEINIGGVAKVVKSLTVIEYEKWYHIVGVYDGTQMMLYINGVLDNTTASVTGSLANTGTSWEIGSRGATKYQGKLDEVCIWNVGLSATQIANLYYDGIIPTTGLVAKYLLNEGSGTTATDSSGNAYNGTITSATYTTDVVMVPRTATTSRTTTSSRLTVRNFATALLFSGGNQYVTPASNLVITNAGVTFSHWLKRSSLQVAINEQFLASSAKYFYRLDSVTGMAVRIYYDGSNSFFSTNVFIQDLEWHHLVTTLRCDGTTVFCTISVDGVNRYTSSKASATIAANEAFKIGNTSQSFQGKMDDFLIFNRVLSAAEISTLYYTGVKPSGSSLILDYKFNEATGTFAGDSSANRNNGVITSATYTTDVPIINRTAV